MRLSGDEALKTKQERKRFPNFGKTWKSGDKLRVLYPVFWDEEKGKWEVLVGHTWGYKIDPKELSIEKRFFIPTNSKIVDGRPLNADALYQFSKIARLFPAGEKEAELQRNIRKAKGDSSVQRTLDEKTAEKFKDKRPVVSSLNLLITTECLVIPLDSNDAVNSAGITMVTQELSETKLVALRGILSDPQFAPEDHDAKFIEVSYTFGNTNDKKVDGKVEPKGVSKEYSTAYREPEVWHTYVEPMLETLPDDSLLIMKRNGSYAHVSEDVIKAGIATYACQASDNLMGLNTAEYLDVVKRNAEYIISLNLTFEGDCKVSDVLKNYETDKASGALNPEGAPSIMDLISDEDIEQAKKANEEESVLEDEPEDSDTSTAANFSGFSNM